MLTETATSVVVRTLVFAVVCLTPMTNVQAQPSATPVEIIAWLGSVDDLANSPALDERFHFVPMASASNRQAILHGFPGKVSVSAESSDVRDGLSVTQSIAYEFHGTRAEMTLRLAKNAACLDVVSMTSRFGAVVRTFHLTDLAGEEPVWQIGSTREWRTYASGYFGRNQRQCAEIIDIWQQQAGLHIGP